MPCLYHQFVDDCMTSQSNIASAETFHTTLNSLHPSFNSLWNYMLVGCYVINRKGQLETKIYIKETMFHHDSHVDVKYFKSLVLTMLNGVFRLSFSRNFYIEKCERLKKTFVRLRYPASLLDNIVTRLITQQHKSDDDPAVPGRNNKQNAVRIMLPFTVATMEAFRKKFDQFIYSSLAVLQINSFKILKKFLKIFTTSCQSECCISLVSVLIGNRKL